MDRSHDIATIVSFLRTTFGLDTATADSPLFQIGGIDSMGLLELVEFIETHFGTTIRSNEITSANFATPARIVEVFAGRRDR
ncbi:MAG TPA: acyl carrier protein [Kofleriaceae bacterium]|nr:acyl carrier protein [Kofleriaceae bacterium]